MTFSQFEFLLPLNLHAWLTAIGAFFLGSIPWGLLFTKWSGKGNIREVGSGNIGATNVLRTGSKFLAFLTLLFDGLKGYIAVKIGHEFHVEYIAAILVVLGHMFPPWLLFKGGKGVSTYAGVLLALSIPLGSQALLCWISFALLFGYSSVSAIITAILVPFSAWLWSYGDALWISTTIISLLILGKHVPNVIRLFKGHEPKIGRTAKIDPAT